MSEKLKLNFTPVPNVILDEIMRTLKPGATRILFAICRYTYGWGKLEGDRISMTQLEDITGMAHGSVARSLKELGRLVTVIPGDPSLQLASHYKINVEISDDDLVSLRDQPPVSKRDQASLLASLIKRPSKDIPKKEEIARAKGARSTAPDPRVKILITAFVEKFQVAVGSSPVITGKDAASFKRLLAAGHDVPAVDSAMDRYFADKFYRQIGFDAAGFAKAFNRLSSAGVKTHHNFEDGAFPPL